jgi:predicted RNA binding protein YcfA (HicA-like mRNA interferase family)
LPGVLPKGLRAEEVIKALEWTGGIRRSGKGSHTNLKMPNGQLITIPGHGEIKVGLLRAAIKKAGLSVDEFLELLGRR